MWCRSLWLRLRNLRAGPISNARAYLFQMANNLVLDRARERRRRSARDHSWTEQSFELAPGAQGQLQPVDPGQTPEDALLDVEEQRALAGGHRRAAGGGAARLPACTSSRDSAIPRWRRGSASAAAAWKNISR